MLATAALAQSSNDIFAKNKKLGRGVNLGNFLEVPRDANWSEDIKVEHLPLIKKAGFDSIRIPIKWSDYAAAEAPYTIEESFAKRVDSYLAEAEKVGLNVVLNIHHYDGLDQEPEKHKDRFQGIWHQLATRYKNRGDWLYFELHNEPHDKLNDHWNEILKVGLSAVRESNPTRPVIIGPINYNGIWTLPKLELPKDDNIIVTVHMYNPFQFTHQGATWSSDDVKTIKNKTFGTAEEIAAVEKELKNAADWGKAHNRPIFVGEFGAYNMAPQESRVKWTQTIARTCESLEMPWAYWEFCAGFGIYDLKAKAWRNDLLHALIPPQ
jgi:endoglucanase